MSFDCQLKLCRKAESERFLGQSRSMFYSYEFKAARAVGVGEDVDRNANDWAVFEARSIRNTSVLQVFARMPHGMGCWPAPR
jgi:hypothetical protein